MLAVDVHKCLTVLRWREQGEVHRFSLCNKVSDKWRKFGRQLDVEANQLEAWSKEYRGDCGECWDHVMEHWLKNGSEGYSVTWEGLYDLLEDVGYSEVASELKNVVSPTHVQTIQPPPQAPQVVQPPPPAPQLPPQASQVSQQPPKTTQRRERRCSML